jgi:hypothetical protein
MKCDSAASLLAHTFASLCFDYEPKAKFVIIWPDGKSSLHLLFLHPIFKWKKNDDVWFTTSPIGYNQL